MRTIDLEFKPVNVTHHRFFGADGVEIENYIRAMVFWDKHPYVVAGDWTRVLEWVSRRAKQFGKPMLVINHCYATRHHSKDMWYWVRIYNCGGLSAIRTDSNNHYIMADYRNGGFGYGPRNKRVRWVFLCRYHPNRKIILETRHIPKRCPKEILEYVKKH